MRTTNRPPQQRAPQQQRPPTATQEPPKAAESTVVDQMNETPTASTLARLPDNAIGQAIREYNHPTILGVIKAQICVGATPAEMWVFLARCTKLQLDPFAGQIYFVKRVSRDGKVSISHIIAIDGFRASAERTGELVHISEPWYEGETTYDGKPVPNEARVEVVRQVGNDLRHFVGVARFTEFVPASPNDFMWKKMPFHMVGKCAEAQAFRKAFPQRFVGVGTDVEAQSPEAIYGGQKAEAQAFRAQNAAPVDVESVEVTDAQTGVIEHEGFTTITEEVFPVDPGDIAPGSQAQAAAEGNSDPPVWCEHSLCCGDAPPMKAVPGSDPPRCPDHLALDQAGEAPA